MLLLDNNTSRPGTLSLSRLITFLISISFDGFKSNEGLIILPGRNFLCEKLFSGIADVSRLVDIYKLFDETVCNSFRINDYFIIMREFIMYP